MKTGLGVEIPRRVLVPWALTVVFFMAASLVLGLTAAGRIHVGIGVCVAGVLLLLAAVLFRVSMRRGAELRRTSAAEFERRGHARGEIVASWRLHWLQLGIFAALGVYSALVLLFGDGHWSNGLVLAGSGVTFTMYARSAYLRRRREQRQRAGGSTAGEAE